MNVAPISMTTGFKSNAASFKGEDKSVKPLINISEDTPDNAVIMYGTWGGNYAYPITAGQLKAAGAKQNTRESSVPVYKPQTDETQEEYLKRKIYSTEWTM